MKEDDNKKDVKNENFEEDEYLLEFKPEESSKLEMRDIKFDTLKESKYESCNTFQNFMKHCPSFSDVNPLRNNQLIDNQNKKTTKHKSKKKVIEELVTNLKTQYVLYNIKYFIRKYLIRINPEINTKSYKILRIIRNISLFVYGILMFFEKPWFCYKGTTLPLPLKFQPQNCTNNIITFSKIPFIDSIILRSVEIIITIIIIVTQILKYKDEYYLLTLNNETMDKSYKIMKIASLIAIVICLIDSFVAVITGLFPIVNFLLRAFIYIYLTRRLRTNWFQIGKVLWRTKPVFFYLILNILIFSFIGYVLFKRDGSEHFPNFKEAILQLYILLSTCNFPDIMLETFEINKISVFYFIIYVSINYFIILSYLKTLYYTKYYSVSKEDCINIIKNIILKKNIQYIFLLEVFKKFIENQKKEYSLNDNEYNNILIILNIYDKNDNLFDDFKKITDEKPEDKVIRSSKVGNYILNNLITEFIINVINLLSLTYLLNGNNLLSQCLHFIWSFINSIEFFYLTYLLGIKRVVTYHFNRTIFHIFNLISIILLIVLFLTKSGNEGDYYYKKIYNLFYVFISLRTIRIFVFLEKFKEIKIIYTIIKNIKEMFYRNLITLYSLYLLFSTLSILLTGGNIKNDSFVNNKSIPENYAHINFNDFGSSYIACLSLMMVNNLQLLVKSLSHNDDSQDKKKSFLNFYFASFYFFSTLIIVNIIQTLLLEMYLTFGYYIHDANKKNGNLAENIKENEENIDNDYKIQ